MAAKMNDGNILLNPIIKFLNGALLFDIVYFTLLEGFLNNALLLKIIDLIIYFITLIIQHGLTVKEQK